MKTLRDIGEHEAIARLVAMLPAGADVVVGPGDDCAVVRPAGGGEDLLLTSDPVVEKVHVRPDDPPEAVGHKAIARALSDIAAMGGEPRWALLNVVAPAATPVQRLEAIYRGAARTAAAFGLSIVGGDLSDGPALELHVFAIGAVPRGEAITRSGAHAGDLLAVTGALGGSRLGRHLAFVPRVREGQWLRPWATAMIDLSDGLATDLRHLAAMSRVGVELDRDAIPVSEAASTMPDHQPALDHALFDGEDFELLFTLRGDQAEAFRQAWSAAFELPCTIIGRLSAREKNIVFRSPDGRREPLKDAGFAHYRAEKNAES